MCKSESTQIVFPKTFAGRTRLILSSCCSLRYRTQPLPQSRACCCRGQLGPSRSVRPSSHPTGGTASVSLRLPLNASARSPFQPLTADRFRRGRVGASAGCAARGRSVPAASGTRGAPRRCCARPKGLLCSCAAGPGGSGRRGS